MLLEDCLECWLFVLHSVHRPYLPSTTLLQPLPTISLTLPHVSYCKLCPKQSIPQMKLKHQDDSVECVVGMEEGKRYRLCLRGLIALLLTATGSLRCNSFSMQRYPIPTILPTHSTRLTSYQHLYPQYYDNFSHNSRPTSALLMLQQ